jgi:preprotein translocase subunit SecG
MLRMVLMVLQVFSSIAIIALVLLQRGKGADAGAGFGAGASGTVFGARGARTALSRATAIFAAIFMLNSLALAYMGTHAKAELPKSILDEAAESAPANSTTPAVPAPATTPELPAPDAPTIPAPASGGTPTPQ